MSISNDQVATLINRTKQAVYCKRWTMQKGVARKRVKKNTEANPIAESGDSIQIKKVVDHIIKTKQFKKLIVGNITIDLENQIVTIAM